MLVRLPTSGLAAVVPAVVDRCGDLPSLCWNVYGSHQPQKKEPLHAATFREGLAMPASERRLRRDPLAAFALVAGAVGTGSGSRGKSPVACGKSADGMSAPPLSFWHCRQ